jgi:hypothetical protein
MGPGFRQDDSGGVVARFDFQQTSPLVVARLDRAIQYSRDSGGSAEKPRRTGSPAFAEDDSECVAPALPIPNTPSHSRGMIYPRFSFRCPSTVEGAGNAGCTLHPRSRVQGCTKESAHEHTGSAEAVRHSLRNGLTAYAALSSATNSFCHRRQRIKTCPSPVGPTHLRWLDISNGCQDHTVLPYATSAVRPARRKPLTSSTSPCDHLARRRCRVHRIPSRVRDDREAPLLPGKDGASW